MAHVDACGVDRLHGFAIADLSHDPLGCRMSLCQACQRTTSTQL